jgi:hypothetical protein
MCPRIRRGVGFVVNPVEHSTGTRELLSAFADYGPLYAVEFFAGLDELGEFAFGFVLDLQFRDVKVLSVIEFSQRDRVHQLRNPFRHLAGIALFSDIEENYSGGRFGVYEVEQVADTFIFDLLLEQVSEMLPQECLVLKSVAEVLGEGAFARPEEAGNPDPGFFVGVGRRVGDVPERFVVLLADAVPGDVFGDLVVNRLLVCLIDLDDLLDLTAKIAVQQIADGLHHCTFISRKS